jgi:starch phosphorylase
MMNGGITLGTLDGANVEIKDFVGDDNIIIFGMTSDQVNHIYMNGGYNPFDLYNSDSRIKTVVDNLTNGFFNNVDFSEFVDIRNKLLQRDEYFVLKDFDAYVKAHEKANELYKNRRKWNQMSLVNIAKSGNFSTDRTMEDYNRDIWHLTKIEEIK